MVDDDLPGWAPAVPPAATREHLTHTEAARACASWLLHKQRHQAATWEVGGPRVPSGEVSMRDRLRPLGDGTFGIVPEPYQPTRGTVLDAVGVEARPDRKPALSVVEVKVSRSDLLADLRARKMLGYEYLESTRLYLAVTPAVAGLDAFGGGWLEAEKPRKELVEELSTMLPVAWGILWVRRQSRHNARPTVDLLRRATHRGTAPDVVAWLGRIASRYSYQALGKDEG